MMIAPSRNKIIIKSFLVYFLFFVFFSGIFFFQTGIDIPCFGVCNQSNKLFISSFNLQFFAIFFLCFFSLNFITKYNYEIKNSINLTFWIVIFLSFISFYLLWEMEFDDKWLLYRISKNIFISYIPTWNISDKINISTSLVWPYLTVYAHFFDDWKTAIKFAGIFFFVLHLIVITKSSILNDFQKKILLIGTGLYLPYIFWSIGGLETSLATFWLFFSILLFYKNGLNSSLTWLAYSAMILIRPESVVGVAISALTYFNLIKKIDLKIIFIISVPVIFWASYNILIFEELLPVPAQIKSFFGYITSRPDNSLAVIMNSSLHLISSILVSCLISLSVISLFIFFKRKLYDNEKDTNFKTLLVLGCGFLAIIIYHLITGYIHMSYVFRYLSPFIIGVFTLNCLFNKNFIQFLCKKTITFSQIFYSCLIIQITILTLSIIYIKNEEVSLTIAPHRDAFSLNAYNGHILNWLKLSDDFNSTIQGDEKIYSFNGNWLVGIARTNIYNIDLLFSPPKYSHKKNIRECYLKECFYDNFDYLVLQNYQQDTIQSIIKSKKFGIYIQDPTLSILKKNN